MLLALIYAFLSAFLVVLLGFFYAQVIAFIDPEQRCSSPPGTIRLFEWVYGCATWLRTKASSSSNNNSNRLAASALAAGAPSPSPHLGNNNSAASACGVRIQTVQVQNDSQQQQQLRPDINLLLGMLLFVVCWSSTRVLSIASAENMSGSAFLLESATFLWVFAEAASRAQRSEALKSAEARAKLVLVLLLASVLAVLLQWSSACWLLLVYGLRLAGDGFLYWLRVTVNASLRVLLCCCCCCQRAVRAVMGSREEAGAAAAAAGAGRAGAGAAGGAPGAGSGEAVAVAVQGGWSDELLMLSRSVGAFTALFLAVPSMLLFAAVVLLS